MSDNSATMMQKAVEAAQQQAAANKAKAAPKQEAAVVAEDKRFVAIKTNTFMQIVADPKLNLKEKKEAIIAAQVYDTTKTAAQNEARLEEFNLFKEYMQEQLKNQSLAVALATDTKVFSRLQTALVDMQKKVDEFDKQMEPLMEILSAVYALNREGNGAGIENAFKEIKQNEEAEKQRKRELEAKEAELKAAVEAQEAAERALAAAKKKKTDLNERANEIMTGKKDPETGDSFRVPLFGMRARFKAEVELINSQGIPETEAAISRIEQQGIPAAAAEVARVAAEVATLRNPPQSAFTGPEEIVKAKEVLREMLNISGTEHNQRQEALVKAVVEFVQTSDVQMKEIMVSYDGLKKGLADTDRSNGGARKIYGILTDAATEVSKKNEEIRKKFEAPTLPEGETESYTDKIEREENYTAVSRHVKVMMESSIDTALVSQKLAKEGNRIATARDMADKQISQARALQSSGSADMAANLSSTLSAVNAAAIAETTLSVSNRFSRMADRTDAINMNEAIVSANGVALQTGVLAKAAQDLAQMAEGMRSNTETYRANVAAQLETKRQLEDMVTQFNEVVQTGKAIVADAVAAEAGTPFSPQAAPVAPTRQPAGVPALDLSKI